MSRQLDVIFVYIIVNDLVALISACISQLQAAALSVDKKTTGWDEVAVPLRSIRNSMPAGSTVAHEQI